MKNTGNLTSYWITIRRKDRCTVDQMVSYYSISRQTRGWTNKLFFNILDLAAYNGCIIWIIQHPQWNPGKNHRRRLYIQEVAQSLIDPHLQHRAQIPQLRNSNRRAMRATGIDPQNASQSTTEAGDGSRCFLCTERTRVRQKCNYCHMLVCKKHSSTKIVCDNC